MLRHIQAENGGENKSGKENGAHNCCKDFYLQVNSRPRRVLDFVQLLNLIYIAFSTPMYISFKIEMAGLAMLLEIVSIVFFAFVILINFRTPVIVKGKPSLQFNQV